MNTDVAVQEIINQCSFTENHVDNDYFSAIRQLVAQRNQEQNPEAKKHWQQGIDQVYDLLRDEMLTNSNAPTSPVKFGTSGWRGMWEALGYADALDEIDETFDAEPLPESMAEGTRIRWLIGEKDSPPTFYMRLFEMGPSGHIKAHFHPWEHEIFVLEGSGEVRIGSRKYRVEAGTAIYIPPNVEHEYWAGGEGMRFLCIIPKGETAPRLEEPLSCG